MLFVLVDCELLSYLYPSIYFLLSFLCIEHTMTSRSVGILFSISLSLASRQWPSAFVAATSNPRSSSLIPITSPSCTTAFVHHSIPRSVALSHSQSNASDLGKAPQKLVGPTVQPPRPNDNTYWVIPNVFIAGEYPGDRSGTEDATRTKLRRYLDLGITSFFDLTFPGEKNDYQAILEDEARRAGINVEYHRFSIPDFGHGL